MLEKFSDKKKVYIIFLFFSIFFLIFLVSQLRKEITGMMTYNTLDVSVKPAVKIRVSTFSYEQYIYGLGSTTNISVEVENIGSTTYEEKIDLMIKNSTLDELAHYYDSTTKLDPGERKSFVVFYRPTDYGVYYIHLRVYYANTKRTESWGVFYVINSTVNQSVIIVPPSEDTGEGIGHTETATSIQAKKEGMRGQPLKKQYLKDLLIELPDRVEVPKGDIMVFPARVINIGNSTQYSLRVVSDVENMSIDFFPKLVSKLQKNESVVFMISVGVPFETAVGLYPLELEFVSDSLRERKKTIINVTDIGLKEIVYQTILNYKFIIGELEIQIQNSSENGIDVEEMQNRLLKIKMEMAIAENDYLNGRYEESYQKLANIRQSIQKFMLDFAIINIPVYVSFRALEIIIYTLLVLLLLLLIALYLIKRVKKEAQKPKMLREATEGGENI